MFVVNSNKKADNTIPFYERYFLMFELFCIFVLFVLTITEIIFSFSFYNKFTDGTKYYHYYMINQRMNIDFYVADIEIINKNFECPENYEKTIFYKLKQLNNITTTEETNEIWNFEKQFNRFANHSVNNDKFFKFDYMKVGDQNIDLLHYYEFNSVYDYYICTLKIKLHEFYDSLHVISLDNENSSCAKYFKNDNFVTCGIYHNTYRMCMNTENLEYFQSNKKLNDDPNTKISDFFCPMTGVNFTIPEIYGSYVYMKNNIVKIKNLNFNGLIQNEKNFDNDQNFDGVNIFKEKFENKFFIGNYDRVVFSNHVDYTILNENATNPNLEINENEYNPSKKNGFIDEFSYFTLQDEFHLFFNYTYYKEPVKVNESLTTYFPLHIKYENDDNYLRPINSLELNPKSFIYLTSNGLPSLSKKCFEGSFKDKKTDLMKIFKGLKTEEINELSKTVIAWLFIELFICLYSHIKIRFQILQKKYLGELNDIDKNSENLTKTLPKILEILVFLVISYSLFYIKNRFKFILEECTNLIENECFTDKINFFLNSYLQYIENMNKTNNSQLIVMYCIVGIECFTLFSYIILYTIDLSMIKQKKIDEDKLEMEIAAFREKKEKQKKS